jgi:Ca2+-binding EF-hand superfamily protein
MNDEEISAAFKLFDINGDGLINLQGITQELNFFLKLFESLINSIYNSQMPLITLFLTFHLL